MFALEESSNPEFTHDSGMGSSENNPQPATDTGEQRFPQFDISKITDPNVHNFAETVQLTPLPGPEHVATLIQQKQQGALNAERLQAGTHIPEAEQASVSEEIALGEAAKEQLMQGHAYLVMELALKYADKGVPIAELVHQGNAELMRAIERYTPGRQQEFATVATWFIRQGMTRLIAEQTVRAAPEKTVVTPDTSVHRLMQLHPEAVTVLTLRELQVLKLRYGLEDLTWRSIKTVAEELGMSREDVQQVDREALKKLRTLPLP